MAVINKDFYKDKHYLPEGIFPSYVESVVFSESVSLNGSISDLLIITYIIKYRNRYRRVKEKYFLPYSDNNKAGKVIKALLGKIPNKLDTDDLIYEDCYIRIEHRPYKDRTWYGVGEVIPWDEKKGSNTKNSTINQYEQEQSKESMFAYECPEASEENSGLYCSDDFLDFDFFDLDYLRELNEQVDLNGSRSWFDDTEEIIRRITWSELYENDHNGTLSAYDSEKNDLKGMNLTEFLNS